jgi:mannose-1-phosphate guanylyltransferase/mannose-6-phosphate isomerase
MGTIANFEKHKAHAISFDTQTQAKRVELMRNQRILIMRLSIPVGGFSTPECHLYSRKKILVLEGCAAINLPTGAVRLLEEEELIISAGTFHRIENHGKIPLTAIEIRTGLTDVDDSYVNLNDTTTQR